MKKYYAMGLMDQQNLHPDTTVNGVPVHVAIEVYRADEIDAFHKLLSVTAQTVQLETRNLPLSEGAREFLQRVADLFDGVTTDSASGKHE
jgi:hypothetical protein